MVIVDNRSHVNGIRMGWDRIGEVSHEMQNAIHSYAYAYACGCINAPRITHHLPILTSSEGGGPMVFIDDVSLALTTTTLNSLCVHKTASKLRRAHRSCGGSRRFFTASDPANIL